MKKILGKYFRFCPKTQRVIGVNKSEKYFKFLFPFIGLAAMVWILIRVIPKPSRIHYPCVKTAMPIASGFIGYIAMLVFAAIALIRTKKPLYHFPIFFLGTFILAGIGGAYFIDTDDTPKFATLSLTPNAPMGTAKGIYPGRVVWVHNANATNENCDPGSYGHGWFLAENNNQDTIDMMVSSAIQNLTGQSNDAAAWSAIFKYHNNTRGKGLVDYATSEKIFIKINATSAWSGNFNTIDLSKVNNSYYGISETSPAVVLSVLRQLVNVVGVAQNDIYIGDPMKHIYKHSYDLWHSEFPNVHYLDVSYSTLGREKVTASTTAKIYYADHGTILKANVWDASRPGTDPIYNDFLYTIYSNMEYMINIPMLKGHKRAGMTMFAKNHFGSHTRSDASQLHNGLVAPREDTTLSYRKGYGLYRIQVDLMSHSLLGKKNLLYLMDALWATDYELDKPLKWMMSPFNNDWMSSVFASLDAVAIESVGYDFLRSEYTTARGAGTYVQMEGVDDYLHQAADSANWPDGIQYDPDSTGALFASLGTHEHWNNATDMQYSRNLGSGSGIELLQRTGDEGLPVEITSFTVSKDESNIKLLWRTATEINNHGFEIEKKFPSQTNWQSIGFVQGAGTSNSSHEYIFIDKYINQGKYAYRLKQLDNDGRFKYSDEIEIIVDAPKYFSLKQNFPNPFNPTTTVSFTIPQKSFVSLKIYDVLGKEVSVLVSEELPSGEHTRYWNGEKFPSGTYFCTFKTDLYSDTKKLLLMR